MRAPQSVRQGKVAPQSVATDSLRLVAAAILDRTLDALESVDGDGVDPHALVHLERLRDGALDLARCLGLREADDEGALGARRRASP